MMVSALEVVSFLHQLLDFAVKSPNTKIINWFPSWIFHEIFLPNTSSFNSFSCSQQVKIIESRNKPGKKIWTNEIPTKKSFGPTKYTRLHPRNTHGEIFRPTKSPWEKIWDTKYPREKNLDPRNTYEKKFWTHKYSRKHMALDLRWYTNHKLSSLFCVSV